MVMSIDRVISELEDIKEQIYTGKASNLMIAEHHSPFKGAGFEIHSINERRLGEPVGKVSWPLSLRTWPRKIFKIDKIVEKEAGVIAVADVSPSVFVEVDSEAGRFRLLLHLIGALGFTANYFHDPFGVLAFSDRIDFYFESKLGESQTYCVIEELLKKAERFNVERLQPRRPRIQEAHAKADLNTALELLLAVTGRQSAIVLLSDFVDTITGRLQINTEALASLSAVHNDNVMALFLDDYQEFAWQARGGLVPIEDIETGATCEIKAGRAGRIRQRFVERREELRRRLGDCGVDSAIISFGDHFNQLAQFLSERKSAR